MKRAITITSMLLLATAFSCRKADDSEQTAGRTKPGDEELAKRIVGTWICENKRFQTRTTYQADGAWRMQTYPAEILKGWESDVEHRLLGVIGKKATTSKMGFRSKGTWRIENGRLLLTEDELPDSEEDLDGLTETLWTKADGNKRHEYVRLDRWAGMTDAEILAHHGTITGALSDPYEGMGRVDVDDKARQGYLLARAHMEYDDYEKAREEFIAMGKNFPKSKYAAPSRLHLRICKAQLAIEAEKWSEAQSEFYRAYLLAKKLNTQSVDGSTFNSWTIAVRGHIKRLYSTKMLRKPFVEAMTDARKLYEAGKYDAAVARLDDLLQSSDEFEVNRLNELNEFKRKILRKRALDECQASFAHAWKVDPSDPSAALDAWGKTWEVVSRNQRYIDFARKERMFADIRKARSKLMSMMEFKMIMASIAAARQSGDRMRLLKTLKEVTTKPAIPMKLRTAWAEETLKIQEEIDFTMVVKLLVDGKVKAAVNALDVFIKDYPENQKAKLIRKGLKKKLETEGVRE